MSMLFVGLTLFVAGLMSVGAAGLNLEVFFSHPTAQPIVKALGRLGARVFYFLLGAVFLVIGAFCTIRGLQMMEILGAS